MAGENSTTEPPMRCEMYDLQFSYYCYVQILLSLRSNPGQRSWADFYLHHMYSLYINSEMKLSFFFKSRWHRAFSLKYIFDLHPEPPVFYLCTVLTHL